MTVAPRVAKVGRGWAALAGAGGLIAAGAAGLMTAAAVPPRPATPAPALALRLQAQPRPANPTAPAPAALASPGTGASPNTAAAARPREVALANGTPSVAPAAPRATAKPEWVTWSADWSESVGSVYHMIGHVKILQGDTVFEAPRVDYDKDKEWAGAPQGLTLTDGHSRVRADAGTADLKAKKAVLTGHVVALIHPRPKAGVPPSSLRAKVRGDITVTCDHLDYYYKEKRLVASGHLRFAEGKRRATADSAIYFGHYDVVVLDGHVQGRDEKGQTFAGSTVKISLKEPDETVEVERFQGTFQVKSESSAEASPTRPPVLPGAPEGVPPG